MLNTTTNTWTTLAPPPYNFTGQKFAYDGNGKIFVFGGGRYFFPTNPNANGYVYDIASNSYSLLTAPNAPAARAGHTICANTNGTWLVWGGSPVAGSVIPPTEQCFKSGALFYLNASNVLVTQAVGDLFLYEKK